MKELREMMTCLTHSIIIEPESGRGEQIVDVRGNFVHIRPVLEGTGLFLQKSMYECRGGLQYKYWHIKQ